MKKLKQFWQRPTWNKQFWDEFRLEFITFYTGFSVLVFEITGARLVAPFVGTSMYVWTSIIGVILLSLAVGYGVGGWWADVSASRKKISGLIFASSIAILCAFLVGDLFAYFLSGFQLDLRVNALLLSLGLFSPASVFLGMVPPHVVKLALTDVNLTGKTVGRLDALSTLGSISGTFLTGFFLLPRFGTYWIMIFLVVSLFLLSIVAAPTKQKRFKASYVFILIVVAMMNNLTTWVRASEGFVDVDTRYSRVQIFPSTYNGNDVLSMQINSNNSSAMLVDDTDGLVFSYTQYYDLYKAWGIDPEMTMMLGGAAYSYPKYFLDDQPGATIDVIEIDSELTQLAREYFFLPRSPQLGIYHQDARVLLNEWDTSRKGEYDVVFGDAFRGRFEIPYVLTTVESMQSVHDVLDEDGIYMINVIGALLGEDGELSQAMITTLREVFPQVEVFLTNPDPYRLQNLMIVASKEEVELELDEEDEFLSMVLDELRFEGEVPDFRFILTDEFAPIEDLVGSYVNY